MLGVQQKAAWLEVSTRLVIFDLHSTGTAPSLPVLLKIAQIDDEAMPDRRVFVRGSASPSSMATHPIASQRADADQALSRIALVVSSGVSERDSRIGNICFVILVVSSRSCDTQ